MHLFRIGAVLGLSGLVLLSGGLQLSQAENAKPKYTIKDVMKALHKGEENIGKKVIKGDGTKEDFAKLVEYYASLPQNEPPKGEKGSWETKSAALLKAAKGLNNHEAGALEAYKTAVDCKACHSAHKPDKKN